MAPVRIRHPKGVATIQIDLDGENVSVQDLQQAIHGATEILPSRQSLKSGYPPRALTLIPELPLSSLGLQKGDPIIVSELPGEPPVNAPAVTSAPPPEAASSRSPLETVTGALSQLLPGSSSKGPDSVEVDGSFLIHRVVPDDNSCLFSSVALVFEQSITKASQVRKIIAEGIKTNPETFNEAILGMPPPKYIETISKPSSWGGAIELSILAQHYQTEIASIDVETGRIDHFTPPGDFSASMRCILIYSGIHYDAASLAPMRDAPDEWHQTLFEIKSSDDSDPILVAAKKLADILRSKKAFTNTSTFDLKCEQCGKGLKGEKEARVHAEQTGHTQFGEY
ncbi:hypothetical protein CPB83DRAFT_856962 [Crepidotus variabilis]|uniref:Ubiquitin thioesterase OTU n=1 Tax=Crepidotus variabilis TaxID=179855 RepID=A0A9P6EDA6_9AGAR|nr:hypothetical protein CPB83DRAFT_856962 [Crepidotus variabilis]